MVELPCVHCHALYRFDPHVAVSIAEADAHRRPGPLVIAQAGEVIHECSPTKETA